MGKLKAADNRNVKNTKAVTNFMGGVSYVPNSLEKLRLIANSSIFGEPSYYRPSVIKNTKFLNTYDIFYAIDSKEAKFNTTEDIFEKAIDAALDSDFKATLEFAVDLRLNMNMRLNPSVIIVRALMHTKRASFNEKNPIFMSECIKKIMMRPDDITNQFEYYMLISNSNKKGLPSMIKRSWAKYLGSMSAFHLNKYKNEGKLIDMVRISHAKSDLINELMKTGSVTVSDSEKTWNNFKSEGKSWKEILQLTYVPHMALLRNLRNIFGEISDRKIAKDVLKQLVKGVAKSKQFPFRYYSAYKAINKSDVHNKVLVLEYLNKCMEEAIDNQPKLKGKTISLCDNSGSAWGTFTAGKGSDANVMDGTSIATIGNLSGIMTAKNSKEGYVGVFGDKLEIMPVTKSSSVFDKLKEVETAGRNIGMGTENGIWLFFKKAIKDKEHWDNIFIYSDMQAGHGSLFGVLKEEPLYAKYKKNVKSRRYIDVVALVEAYRKEVNPFVNIITVQTGGYDNTLIPENLYRGAILSGWTGKEVMFAYEMDKTWTDIEKRSEGKSKKEESFILKPIK